MLISLWIRDKFFGGCLDILDIGSWGFFWGRLQLLVHIIRKLLSYWRDGGKGTSYLSFGGFRALWQNNESFNVSYKSKIRNISQTLRACWLLTNNPLNKSYTRRQLRSPEKKMQNHRELRKPFHAYIVGVFDRGMGAFGWKITSKAVLAAGVK